MQDKDTLMNLLTFKAVKEKVSQEEREEGQNVMLEDSADKQENIANGECKVDPKVLSKLYDQWVMPLTKESRMSKLSTFSADLIDHTKIVCSYKNDLCFWVL
jgi:chorismate mutase